MKLSIKGMALAMGMVWALSMLVTGLAAMHGMGGMFVEVMSSMYKGYDASIKGALIGTGWGFVDGLIGGALLAFFYNKCSGCCSKE